MKISEKIYCLIRKQNIIQSGDFVIVGVSGGADSIALLHLLSKWTKKIGFALLAVHVHHGLRGEEADRDAKFVKDFCEKIKTDFIRVDIDLNTLAKQERMGIEEAGRKYRYMIFDLLREEYLHYNRVSPCFSYKNIEESWKEKNKDFPISLWENSIKGKDDAVPKLQEGSAVKIALAHHKDDQAETILFHLIRGSGLRGGSGMQIQRESIIRPMLSISREEIEEYLRNENVSFCTDSSNHTNDYARNILRNEILPTIRSKINPMVSEHIVRAGNMFFEADDFFTQAALKVLEESACKKTDSIKIAVKILSENPPIMRKYIIRMMFVKILENRGLTFHNIHYQHVTDIEKLLEAQTPARVDLPFSMFAKREYADIIISLRKSRGNLNRLGSFVSRVFPYEAYSPGVRNENIAQFDFDKLDGPLVLRKRETGDYIYLRGVGKKTVKSFMTDKKISQELRDEVPLIACNHHVVWIVGYRISDAFSVDEHTKQVLEIQYKKEKEDELSY